ncbi:MAG TPA: hypothetical protein VE132_04795, partial [Micromonosporaceae bacterium]|nr:hypothetical protein [Micromonosporaceae bacterium]
KGRPKSAAGHGGRDGLDRGQRSPPEASVLTGEQTHRAPATSKRIARRASGKDEDRSKGAKLKKTAVRERDEGLQSNSSDVTVADAVLIGSVNGSGRVT